MLERLFIFLMVIFTIGLSTGVSSARQVELKSNYNTAVQNISLNKEETNWLAHKKNISGWHLVTGSLPYCLSKQRGKLSGR